MNGAMLALGAALASLVIQPGVVPVDWPPQFPTVTPRIAYEDRFLFLENEGLLINGELYCLTDELEALTPGETEFEQSITYEEKSYAPVREYYESMGLHVIQDEDLDIVRVYAAKPQYGGQLPFTEVHVFLYHHILDNAENTNFQDNALTISTESFEAQMKYLSDNGYTTITLLQLYDFLYRGRSLPLRSVLITFDDGYYSNLTRAYPILKKYNQTAVLFAITGNLPPEKEVFDPDVLQFAAVPDLKEYSDVFEYATHTHALHKSDNQVTYFSKADTDTTLADLAESLAIVNNPLALAYPLGMYNDEKIRLLKGTSIKLAFTTKDGAVYADSNPYEINRKTIWKATTVSGFSRMLNCYCGYPQCVCPPTYEWPFYFSEY